MYFTEITLKKLKFVSGGGVSYVRKGTVSERVRVVGCFVVLRGGPRGSVSGRKKPS